jgi:purine-nucleoside phosphorylase
MTTVKESVSVEKALHRLSKILPETPQAAVVLGSGIDILNDLSETVSVSFQEIFGTSPTVEGHRGQITVGRLDDRLLLVLRGRFHLYEGYSWDIVTLPTRVIAALGVSYLYSTNACGGLNPSYRVGDLMLITGYRDHLHPRWKDLGLLPAIAAASVPCVNKLTEHIWQTAQELAGQHNDFRSLHQGVYVGCLGPCYETMAEVEMLRRLKADVVSMSTIPELVSASGTLVGAVATITNSWNDETIHGHQAVMAAANAASQRLELLLRQAILSAP